MISGRMVVHDSIIIELYGHAFGMYNLFINYLRYVSKAHPYNLGSFETPSRPDGQSKDLYSHEYRNSGMAEESVPFRNIRSPLIAVYLKSRK